MYRPYEYLHSDSMLLTQLTYVSLFFLVKGSIESKNIYNFFIEIAVPDSDNDPKILIYKGNSYKKTK